jgi:flagellar basal body rod protein FlgG
MNYGMWVAASGVLTSMTSQDVQSNNLANASTTAFKPDALPIRQRATVRDEDNLPWMDSNRMLERLGAGVMPEATVPKLGQGSLRATDNPFDVAVRGSAFMRVEAANPEGFALTRDGRLTIGSDGTLARVADGAQVLDRAGSPIALNRALPVRIDADGSVNQGGARVGVIDLVTVAQPTTLRKQGDGNFRLPHGAQVGALRRDHGAQLVAGSIEESGVNAISTLMGITNASRAAQGGMRMITTLDQINAAAITRLGRVS